MKTFPLESITLEEAKKKQFDLIDTITTHFTGEEMLSLGDLGVRSGTNKPYQTIKVEEVLADYFGAEKAVLVRGAGTGALRWGFISHLKAGDKVLVHDAPVYPTSLVSLETMGVEFIKADFNNICDLERVLLENKGQLKSALVQYTRQKIEDSYEIEEVISKIKEVDKDIIIITDDNYAVMKVEKIGVELGADLSAFSLFKLLGPEGIGCLIGKKKLIEKIVKYNYSGGSQVQGYEAMEVLRGLTYAPVALAIQGEVNENLCKRLESGELEFIKGAVLANAQSKVLLVEFKEEIADEILKEASKLGALPNPVGAESKYEFVPLFYRISGTFRKADSTLEKKMIRINPNRSGEKTIIRILKEAYKRVKESK